jgi:hypothetical protein
MTIEDIDLTDIYEFMERGDVRNAPEHIVKYLSLLDAARGMMLKIDKYSNDEMIIKHFILVENISRYKAKKIIDEAREYFYKDKVVSIQAWRNIYAEKAEKALNFAMLQMKDVKDATAVIKAIKDIFDIRGGNLEEKEELPEELFQKQMIVYSTNAEELGLPKVDRNRLKEFIDKKIPELSEKERDRLYQEADIIPFKTFLNEQENPRKV